MEKVVTRFAPSPTGFMHIGGVRTALFAYLLARKNNGTFILRIEDTDKEREVAGSIPHIMESLRWLGIEWDWGPDDTQKNKKPAFGSCIQSERLETYHAVARALVAKGHAYPDPYTSEELAVFRTQAEAEKRPFLFRNHRPEVSEVWDGKRPLRFKVPTIKRMQWRDAVRGDLEAGEEALDDFILIKGDGYPTYNFAHIVDDFNMGVTHIMRGDEFISSTPKFLSLYEALEIPVPQFVTLPPILRDDKTKKLGKRDGAKDILDYRAEGYLPDALRNFLALIGWNPGTEQEIFPTLEALVSAFDIAQIQTHGGAFNEEKLLWMNGEYIKALSSEDLYTYLAPVVQEGIGARLPYNSDITRRLVEVLRNSATLSSVVKKLVEEGEFDFLFAPPSVDSALVPNKNVSVAQTKLHLQRVAELLLHADFSSTETIKSALWDYATEQGRGDVLWPLRVALSGKKQSPDPFVIASMVGKEETQRRITSALALLG